jgi:ribosomal-protein-alanine N-acetyltransferase
MNELTTPRLRLVPATAELIRLELENPSRFFDRLGVDYAVGWPSADLASALPLFAEALERDPWLVGWMAWYWIFVNFGAHKLVGGGGFKGAPVDGVVEIGYETRSAFRQQGFATEAVGRLTQWALSHRTVDAVVADADAGNAASIGVLRRTGFREIGPGSDLGVRRYRLDK